ncbi:MAG TPA: PhoH family protein [Candidatus Agathobaculum merdigallinarum]|nr:PhoH family protein [Candidatus Agathobaculum merdigallinarum]
MTGRRGGHRPPVSTANDESKVQTIERTIQVEQTELLMAVFGAFDENIKLIERELGVSVVSRGTELKISGEDAEVDVAARTIGALTAMAGRGEAISTQTVQYVIGLARDGREAEVHTMSRDVLCITAKGKPVKAKTLGQKRYMEAIRKNTIVMGVGPAGTGKTYLAVAAAVAAFRDKRVSRIILTRPAVEAGEKLGFLPGDLQSKVDPYLRPLYDGLFDMLGAENFAKYQERGSIEVAPLAYMRGRTLDDSFIILDEAQNTSPEQMKMFLTRLGFGSQAVITGDITQVDLPDGKQSGLKEALRVLDGVEGIAQCYLTEKDVVRHELVQRIVKAYADYESKKGKSKAPDNKHPGFRRKGEKR